MEVFVELQKSDFLHGKIFSLGTAYPGLLTQETLYSLITNCSICNIQGTQHMNKHALYHAKF